MLPTPYVDLDRRAWSRLRENHPMSLEQSDLARLRGLGERLDLNEVEEVYLPLSRLLHFYVEATHGLRLATSALPLPLVGPVDRSHGRQVLMSSAWRTAMGGMVGRPDCGPPSSR